MNRYLVTLEFRYTDEPDRYDSIYRNKMITIGIYDDYEEACKHGNQALVKLEQKYPLHVFPDGRKANQDRLSSKGGAFNSKRNLITNVAYLQTPFEFYLKIATLDFTTLIDEVVDEVKESVKRYRKFKSQC